MRFDPSTAATINQLESQACNTKKKKVDELNGLAYVLWFIPEGEDGEEDALMIGVYASESDAELAIQRLQSKPGFSSYAQGFQVHSYEVGRDYWTEGFIRE